MQRVPYYCTWNRQKAQASLLIALCGPPHGICIKFMLEP